MKGFYYSAAAVRLLMNHVEQGIPDREPIDVVRVAELNIADRAIAWFKSEETLELETVVGNWEQHYYWGFHPESGVIAYWHRKVDNPRTYIFRLLKSDTAYEVCIEIARELREHRAPDMRPPLNAEGTYSTKEWDTTLTGIWSELEKIEKLTSDQTVKVNERGPQHFELAVLHTAYADLIQMREGLTKYFT